MSSGTFFGDIIRNPFSFDPIGDARKKRAKANESRDAAATEEKAKVVTRAQAAEVQQRQKAKQVAAINTPSRGFGANSLENLSRSFLLRL
jgi:hypothetical protein